MSFNTEYSGLEMAVIGMSCKFPESNDYKSFWDNLSEGKELIREYTDEDILSSGVPAELLNNSSFIKSGVEFEGRGDFDHDFFEYRREEAALMDPQIRIMHEFCWKAIEDAGYASLIKKKKIGLFLGASENIQWKMYSYLKSKEGMVDPFFLNMISNSNYISSLISYKLNLTGPALFVDTACSTSLMTVNLACKSLLNRECNIALAGGVRISSSMEKGYLYKEGLIYSNDGHCRAFDKDASGTIAGEGVGVVVLKRLKDAIKDKDNIYSVIRSCVSNNDGNNKVGYTAPSVQGQLECIRLAHKMAGVSPSSIGYIETHGTGTKLGDPIELRALNLAFNKDSKEKFCAIGSVKTNMGHLDVASGIAGLIKTILCVKNRQIPPSLNFNESNPEIDFDGGPFYVNTELKKWKAKKGFPLRAGVSSFGIGGTNVHVVLEEMKEENNISYLDNYKLLTLSGKTEKALDRAKKDISTFLKKEPKINLDDLVYTLQSGRKDFFHRYHIAFKKREELIEKLDSDKLLELPFKKATKRNPSLIFMFPGQGTQYLSMGKDLYDSESFFQEEMDKGFNLYEKLTGEDLKSIIFSKNEKENRIVQTIYSQPLIFILEYSLAQLMMSWGINPDYMIGHSIGEYVAACLSGVFSYKDALKLIVKRAELMNNLAPGSMVSCNVNSLEINEFLIKGISLAAVNSDNQVVFSGDPLSIKKLIEKLKNGKIPFVKLHTSHAFHSSMLDEILDNFKQEVLKVQFGDLKIPFVSNVHGQIVSIEEALSPEYWVSHMRETVMFSKGLKTLLRNDKEKIFIEVGPGNALTSLLKQHSTEKFVPSTINLIKHPKAKENDIRFLTNQLGLLWSYGFDIAWNLIYKDDYKKISVPTYSFERNSFPAQVNPFEKKISNLISPEENKLSKNFNEWIYFPIWKNSVSTSEISKSQRKSFIFFSLDDDFSDLVIKELIKKNNDVIQVVPKEKFIKYSKNKFAVDPNSLEDIQSLFSDLEDNEADFTDIIYSWCVDSKESEIKLFENNREINLLYFSLIRIIKILEERNSIKNKNLKILTNCLYEIDSQDEIKHKQSLTSGLTNTISQEFSIPSVNLDINLKNNLIELVPNVVNELLNSFENHIVALRDGKRWIPDYQQYDKPIENIDNSLQSGNVYLITGGLGNIGYILSQHLIKEYNAKLVLIGRKKIEEKNTHNSKSLERLNHLKNIGDDVRYFSLDIGEREGLEDIVLEVEKDLGQINGVIHTAGMTDSNNFQYIKEISYERAFEVFSPKIKGIETIYNVFNNREVDFVWITSSLSSILGGLGYASYSAANLYMDYFISAKVKKNDNWKSVRLGELSFNENLLETQQDSNKIALNSNEIIKLFEWSLSLKGRQIIVETITGLYDRINKAFYNKIRNYEGEFEIDAVERRERPPLMNPYIKPVSDTEKKIVEIIENYFGINGVGIEDDFFDLGGDSLKAMVLLSKVKEIFNVDISLKEFFDNQCVKKIASKIDEKLWINEDNNKKYISII